MVGQTVRRSALIKNAVASALWWSGLSSPHRVGAGKLTVLTVHRVLPREHIATYPFPDLCITPRELEQCLEFTAQHFDVDTITAQVRKLRSVRESGRPLLAMTFDDGQWDNFQFAAPILRKHGFRATFYIPVHHVDAAQLIWHDRLGFSALQLLQSKRGRDFARDALVRAGLLPDGHFTVEALCEAVKHLNRSARAEFVEALEREAATTPPSWSRLMSWDEIRELAAIGHEIGSHSMSHELLPQQDDAELQWEVVESRRRLSAATGLMIESFCYPNGSFDDRCLKQVQQGSYSNAVTTRIGLHSPRDDDYAMNRVYVDSRCFAGASGDESGKKLAMRVFLSSRARHNSSAER